MGRIAVVEVEEPKGGIDWSEVADWRPSPATRRALYRFRQPKPLVKQCDARLAARLLDVLIDIAEEGVRP